MFIGLVVVECGKSKFFCLNMSVLGGLGLGILFVFYVWKQLWFMFLGEMLRASTFGLLKSKSNFEMLQKHRRLNYNTAFFGKSLEVSRKKLIFSIG